MACSEHFDDDVSQAASVTTVASLHAALPLTMLPSQAFFVTLQASAAARVSELQLHGFVMAS
jgi:hypothetical protein